ncbi:MFS transporter [Virgisporangium aurantiacum]|uniref:MFS transporter n=2 Tax=Virgisporangium aurantiacum TaxID=175570 RepID=A0A8J3ZI16_9ACTN|nr:MFS transporter [Virgisporangium aurantiacum]
MLALLSAAQFMLILDITVVNIALPDIGSDLGLQRDALTWVVTAYTLMFGGLMLVGGRAADLFGARRVLLAGLTVFTAASLAAGLAPNAAVLVGGRAFQGVGAALISPAALAIVTTTFHGADRHRALGVWAALGGTGSAVGVLLGGLLTAGPGWQWVFFINVPVGVAVLAGLSAIAPASQPAVRGRRIDLPGAVLVTAATGALIYALITAGDVGWVAAPTLAALGAAGLLYAGFAVVQRTVRAPLIDLRVLLRRRVSAGAFLMLVATGLLVAGFFLGSFHLQHVAGYSAAGTGLAFLPVAVATIVGAHAGGRAIGRIGARPLATVGLLIAAAGAGTVAVWTTAPALIVGVSVGAAGLGATFVAATTTALAHTDPAEAGVRSGLVNTFHELGAALGVATVSAIAATSLAGTGTGAPATGGFTAAFAFSAAAALTAAVLAAVLVPAGRPPAGAVRHMH